MTTIHDIRERLANRKRFSLAEVRGWMVDETSLELWAALYEVLGPGWKLVKPEPDMNETCSFITRYLLRCIHENVQSQDHGVPTGYEAAHILAACLKHWAVKVWEKAAALTEAAAEITAAYRAADDAEQDRLLNGAIEHALEAAAVRPYFLPWKDDPVLSEPWRLAMQWALAHGEPAAA